MTYMTACARVANALLDNDKFLPDLNEHDDSSLPVILQKYFPRKKPYSDEEAAVLTCLANDFDSDRDNTPEDKATIIRAMAEVISRRAA